MRYFQPKSLSWWAGALSAIIGLLKLFGFTHPLLAPITDLVNVLSGGADASPVAMITAGLGIIGIRDKLERMS